MRNGSVRVVRREGAAMHHERNLLLLRLVVRQLLRMLWMKLRLRLRLRRLRGHECLPMQL